MDIETLSRIQFALTISFHYIYPPLSIGLGVMLVIMEGIYVWSKDVKYLHMAKFWTRIFALVFSIGVATGIVMEFEFGTNWAEYSRFVGDVFGSALASEGVFAFFLESGFLAFLLFGWDKIGPKTHFFAACMVALGAHFSAVWIVVANSWMHTPAGYHIVNGRAEITDFWAMVFNPSSMERLSHTIVGAWLAGAFVVLSVSAFYLLKKRHRNFALSSMRIALSVAFVSIILQAILGDISAKGVARNQPAKLAAFEAHFKTEKNAPLVLFGSVNTEEQRVEYGIAIPGLLSWLIYGDTQQEVTGLDAFPKDEWPRVAWVFQTYRIMLAMWALMFVTVLWGGFLWWRGKLADSPWALRWMVLSSIFPQWANQSGWFAAEMGRYPWIVQGLMKVPEGLSKNVDKEQVIGSLILFTLVYTLLFFLFLFLFDRKIRKGPSEPDAESPYHHMQQMY